MGIERLKHMKDCVMCCVEKQMCHLDTVNTKELGEAIDMIKDLEEAIYYHTITKAMGEEKETRHWPKEKIHEYNNEWKEDYESEHEGHSEEVRKLYMEKKHAEHPKEELMKELEKYVHELTEDIVEMIEDATAEEKQFLSKKIATLATKIGAAK